MAIQTTWGTQGVVYVDGERVGVTGPPSWSQDVEEEIVNGMVQYHPAQKSLEISVECVVDNVALDALVNESYGDIASVRFGGQRWFEPVYVLNSARVEAFEPNAPEQGAATLWLSARQFEKEFANWYAGPIYWLWRQWLKVKGLVRKFRWFGTER